MIGVNKIRLHPIKPIKHGTLSRKIWKMHNRGLQTRKHNQINNVCHKKKLQGLLINELEWAAGNYTQNQI